jgi:hypothetical protein
LEDHVSVGRVVTPVAPSAGLGELGGVGSLGLLAAWRDDAGARPASAVTMEK